MKKATKKGRVTEFAKTIGENTPRVASDRPRQAVLDGELVPNAEAKIPLKMTNRHG